MIGDPRAVKASTDHQKARTAVVWALVVLLWVVILFAIGVLPAAIAAGWKWFL